MPTGYRCTRTSSVRPKKGELTWSVGFPKYADQGAPSPSEMLAMMLSLSESDSWSEELKEKLIEFDHFYQDEIDPTLDGGYYSASRNPMYISVGRSFSTPFEVSEALPANYSDLEKFNILYNSRFHFFTTNLVGSGMSGGGVFNTSGHLTGLFNAFFGLNKHLYSHGLTPGAVYITIDHIKNEISEKLGEEFLDEAFNCQN